MAPESSDSFEIKSGPEPEDQHFLDQTLDIPMNNGPERVRAPSPPYLSGPTFVYAIGKMTPRFPNLGIQKELAQVIGTVDTTGQTDLEATHTVLSEPAHRYIVRQLCWVLTIEGIETYLIRPRDAVVGDLLIDAIRGDAGPTDIDVVIGTLGDVATPDVCNGLVLPIVHLDHFYAFDVESLVRALPAPKEEDRARFDQTAEQVFSRLIQIADNTGVTDGHRALNYLSVRYSAVYERAFEMHQNQWGLSSVDTLTSRLAGARRIVDVIFSFTHRQTDVIERHFTRVDVTDEFPFLVTKWSPYFDR
jgi:hypothetical protein